MQNYKWTLASVALLASLLVPAIGTAGIGDPAPVNPCGAAPFATQLAIIDVTGAGGLCVPPFAETAITCTLKRGIPNPAPADIAVEIYDETTGLTISGPVCAAAALPAGSSITMVTNPLITPHFPGAFPIPAPGGSCGAGCYLHASARVFSTGRMTCTAARIDVANPCIAGFPSITTKDLKVLRPAAVQHGD